MPTTAPTREAPSQSPPCPPWCADHHDVGPDVLHSEHRPGSLAAGSRLAFRERVDRDGVPGAVVLVLGTVTAQAPGTTEHDGVRLDAEHAAAVAAWLTERRRLAS